MTSKAQRVRVGAFTVAVVALGAVVLIVFGGLRFWERHAHYRIVFTSSVMGLQGGASVYLDGVEVGQVEGVAIAPDDLRKVVVTIEVARDTPVRADTRATMQLAGITGLKVVELRGGSYAAPAVADGGTIGEGEGTIDKLEREADQLAERADAMVDKSNRILDNLVAVTDPKRFAAIDEIVAQARVAGANLAAATGSMRAMIDDDRVVLHDALVAMRETARSADALVDGPLAHLAGDADDLVATARGLVTSNAGPLRAAVFDLRQASRSVAELAREVRQRPSRLLFSSAPAERKLP